MGKDKLLCAKRPGRGTCPVLIGKRVLPGKESGCGALGMQARPVRGQQSQLRGAGGYGHVFLEVEMEDNEGRNGEGDPTAREGPP